MNVGGRRATMVYTPKFSFWNRTWNSWLAFSIPISSSFTSIKNLPYTLSCLLLSFHSSIPLYSFELCLSPYPARESLILTQKGWTAEHIFSFLHTKRDEVLEGVEPLLHCASINPTIISVERAALQLTYTTARKFH